jgi:hypothetical protein
VGFDSFCLVVVYMLLSGINAEKRGFVEDYRPIC